MKNLIKRYKHAWVLLYFPIYIIWFFYLQTITDYTRIHITLDDYIPFNEWLIFPYYFWFIFIILVVGYLFFMNTKEYYRCTAFLFIGMTICLTIYTVWPNGQDLRPDLLTIGRDNIALKIVAFLYRTDSNTNVCPSIHVYNSIGVCIGVLHDNKLRKKKYITVPSIILAVLICLATVFLKQHSSFDILCSIILSIIMYAIVYVPDYGKLYQRFRQYRSGKFNAASDKTND